ncbi:hypothetical protein ED236_09280 [Pseudomethylobacillus aquaticus]|uniref:Flagellar protein n=1 Tax=Pseudomethylobacillus aquaticus TaxID=2676064 RepID=A0A3N0V083_9PROT|nr:flagellar biosynthetic protein FliO [Pseudomethylobacillus aquaticus]ROH85911.1 hypothetical protein ED236_09280 [Pseudomethylobacillus aquaticus]
MSLSRILLPLLLAWGLLTNHASIAEQIASPTGQSQIPFKQAPTPFESHGTRVSIVMLLLLGVAGVLYVLIKKNPKFSTLIPARHGQRVQVVEKVRLNAKATLYVVTFDGEVLLIGQSGDRLVRLSDAKATKPVQRAIDV